MAARNDGRELIRLMAGAALARDDFFTYCNLMAPDFYRPERQYLRDLCSGLQDFYGSSDDKVMVISIPPRFGKSRTVGRFVEWVLGRDQTQKIMTGSYNETLSTTFAKNVRNDIMEQKADLYRPVFSDVFPGVRIKRGDGAMNLWSLEGGYNNYLATSPTGTATGFGASLIIVDDIIKNAYEANNEVVKEGHWTWFTDTMLTRLEEGGKIIIIMTRWASDDLAGRVIEHYEQEGIKVRKVVMKAVQDDGSMLCEDILSMESYIEKTRAMSPEIASANYQQVPLDIKGRLYNTFKTYDKLPQDDKGNSLLEGRYAYFDTADEGSDYLCGMIYGLYNREAYILDILYTQAPMTETEPESARMLMENRVDEARIESNNGGSGFARSVQRILQEELHYTWTKVSWFHQTKNKNARILSNASWVQNHIYYPANWYDRWPEYYAAMKRYQREGKNTHDDAPDATTGVAESTVMIVGG